MYINFLIGSGYRVLEKRGVGEGKGYLSISIAIAIADNAACSVDPIHLIDRLNVNIIIICMRRPRCRRTYPLESPFVLQHIILYACIIILWYYLGIYRVTVVTVCQVPQWRSFQNLLHDNIITYCSCLQIYVYYYNIIIWYDIYMCAWKWLSLAGYNMLCVRHLLLLLLWYGRGPRGGEV